MDFDTLDANNSETFIGLINDDSKLKAYHQLQRMFKLRKAVFEFIISRRSEDEYIDISNHAAEDVKKIQEELLKAKWKTQLSYGDTGLFIFRDEKPGNCW
jgi:hypothetical protein